MIGGAIEEGLEHDRLFEMILRLSSRIDQPTLLEDILCSISSFWRTGVGALLLCDGPDHRLRVATSIGLPADFLRVIEGPAGSALLAYALADGEPKSISDLVAHPRDHALAAGVVPPGFQSAHLLPLITPAGTAIGALALYFEQPPEAADLELRYHTLLGPLLAQYIFTARAHAVVKRAASRFRSRAKKLNGLAEACATLATLTDPRAVMLSAANLATTWISAEGCLIDRIGSTNQIVATEGICRTPGHVCGGRCSTPSEGIRAELLIQLVRTRAPVVIRGASAAQLEIPGAVDAPDRWDDPARTTLLYLPLLSLGEIVGAMVVVRLESNRDSSDEDLLLASEIARHTALALTTLRPHRAPVIPS